MEEESTSETASGGPHCFNAVRPLLSGGFRCRGAIDPLAAPFFLEWPWRLFYIFAGLQ